MKFYYFKSIFRPKLNLKLMWGLLIDLMKMLLKKVLPLIHLNMLSCIHIFWTDQQVCVLMNNWKTRHIILAIKAIYIYENNRDHTRFVSRLQPRFGCGYEYYAGEFKCDPTMTSYRWVVEGIDYQGYLWRRSNPFACAGMFKVSWSSDRLLVPAKYFGCKVELNLPIVRFSSRVKQLDTA
jgi:hypothetical protein